MLRYMGFHLYISTKVGTAIAAPTFFCGDKTPQSSCDSPGLVTAPVSRWEPDSPDPLSRFARYAHVFFQPPVTS